ncbi:MAG TPA: EAL domain-containing protein [Burkholderiales bacterium]|nr:EAL domain-containing protein [Burkholderiales bacterium]
MRRWLRQPAAWAILGVGALVSLSAWRSLTVEVEQAARASFNAVVADSRQALETRLRGYQLVLLGMQGLFRAKPDVDRASFERYIAELAAEKNASRARAFSYAKYVAYAEKERFINAVRLDRSVHPGGYPRFAIRPAGERTEYVVITYVAPFAPNERALGLDLVADPVRRLSVERTRDTGTIVASGPVTLALTDERGTSLRLAVYRRARGLDSPEARREFFDGIVSVTFGARDAIGDIVARHAADKLRLRVADTGEMFYDSASGPIEADALSTHTALEIGGRRWDLQFSAPLQAFRTAGDALTPWLTLGGGLAISVLLAGLVGSLSTSTQRAHRIAREITEDLRRSQAELREAQRKTELLIETLPNPVFFKGRDGKYLGVNKAWEAFFQRSRASIIGRPVHELYPHAPQIAVSMHAADQRLWAEPGTQSYEATLVLPDGTQRETLYYKATFTGPDGEVAGLIGTIIDITERKQAEKRQAMEHAITRVLAGTADTATTIPGVIRILCDALGWKGGALWRREAQRREPVLIASWGSAPARIESLESSGVQWQAERDSSLSVPLSLGRDALGAMVFAGVPRAPDRDLIAMLQAIGSQVAQYLQRTQAEDALRFVATHDALTGLPNRVMFNQRLEHAIMQAKRHRRQLALLFIDLDRFKVINDTLGHEFGDTLLRDVAQRLMQSLRASDSVARLGGDEFVVLLEEISAPMYVAAVAQKLISTLAQGFALAGKEYHVSASIGVSTYPADGETAAGMLKNADIAMYRAKEQGRNTFQFYAAEQNIHTVERLTLESGLRRALERGQLVLHYQPQVETASGRITGVEALLRWQHPELGLLPPASFIAIAEETGLIVPIGQWVLHAACAMQRTWREAGLAPLRMSINLSPRQFLYDGLARDIEMIVRTSDADAAYLELEITEGMVMQDPERAVAVLRDMRNIGVRIAIDDFGTGHSSLAYLKRFPVDNLKIDRSFIADTPADRGAAAITQAIIAMAHSLELKVIAEGVETEAQYQFLLAQGCDEYQGYFFSKPLPAEQVRALVEDAAARAVAVIAR